MTIWGTSRDLLARFEVGQDSADLFGHFEVGQNFASLFAKVEIQQPSSADLLGRIDITHSVELLGKGKVQQSNTAELLGKTEIQQPGSAELLGECNIIHSTELLCNAIIKNVGSAVLYARAEVGQGSRNLLAKFEAQDVQVLYAKGAVRQADLSELYARTEVGQGSGELFAKAVVGQGSVELLGRGIVRNAASSDLKGTVDITHSIDLLGRAVIGHPALPVWLKAIFSIGLTNAYRDLGSISELRRGAFIELLGKVVIKHVGMPAELLGKTVIGQPGSAELLGNCIIRNVSSAEMLCNFTAQSLGDLKAKMIIGPAKDSDTYFSFWDPSDWINEVMGIGQGFIVIPFVEADAVVKTYGSSSARLTSTSASDQYKEIRFGWGGMNWGVEAAVSPEVAPTPINTGGRGPRRGSSAERDERREVPQSSYKELKGIFTVNELAGVVAQLRDITDARGWWQNAYDDGVSFILVPNADGTLTLRSNIAAGVPAIGGGAYGTNKAFIPTAGNPITIEWEIQCSTPVGPGTTFSIHYLGGLIDSRFTSSGTNEISLYYDGDAGQHILEIYEDGVNSYNADWTTVDITDKTKFKIIWEHPDDVAPNGRVRVYIDDVLTLTETTVVPETELCFFFGIMLVRNAGTPTAEATLHSISEL